MFVDNETNFFLKKIIPLTYAKITHIRGGMNYQVSAQIRFPKKIKKNMSLSYSIVGMML